MPHTTIHWAELFIATLAEVVLLGFSAYLFIMNRRQTKYLYLKLCMPSWSPPVWSFSIIWSIAYIIESVAYVMVRLRGEWVGRHLMWGLILFWIAQFVMLWWTPVFHRSLGWSFFICLLSLALLGVVTWLFWFVHVTAGILMLIVSIWLLFATILSLVTWWKNWEADVPSMCCDNTVKIV